MSLKEQWVSWDELYAFIAGGLFDPNVIIDAGNVGGLTAGSIPFANATGFLAEDNASLFWDAASEYLKITSASTLLLDLDPGFTGTGEVINITPSAAIDTIDAEWSGIVIDGDALDPSVIGVHIDGLHIDFSTIDVTNLPHIDAIHIQMPSCLCGMHGIHVDGELHINLDATVAVTGEEYTGIDVVVATTGSTGGDIHVLDVARGGAGAVGIAAIGTHEGIDVIHQAIGTFAAADKIWEYDNDGPTWIDVTAGVGSIWDDKDDLLYVGHASTFSEIKFMFTVVATKDMHFKFYFSAGAAVWTPFEPADDTNGATQNGSVRFTAASLPTWAVDTVNAIANKYWILIERTRTSGTGPTTSSMQQLAPTLYGWDKLGAITALTISATTAKLSNLTDGYIPYHVSDAAGLANSSIFIDGTKVFINETINTKMTTGLTIHQGAALDEILAFKQTGVAHGITDWAETDTYGMFRILENVVGGISFWGFTENIQAFAFRGVATNDNADKDATAIAPITMFVYKKNGTGLGPVGANANLFVVKHGGDGTAKLVLDVNGDLFIDGAYDTFQEHDDISLIAELEDILSDKISKIEMKKRDVYKKHKIVHVSEGIDEENRPYFSRFVSTKRKNMLLYGAIRQLNKKIETLEAQLNN